MEKLAVSRLQSSVQISVDSRLQPVPEAPLFRGLTSDRYLALQNLHGRHRSAERDEQLVTAWDPRAPLVTICRGWAIRYCMLPDGRRQVLSLLLPGDTIGVGNLLTGAPSYPVQAATTVLYSMIDRDHAEQFLEAEPWFVQRVAAAVGVEQMEAEMTLTRLGQCSAEERVASALLELHGRLVVRGLAAKNSFFLDLTQQHLADYVGLTVVHLNRMLGRLRARLLIAMSGHQVTLLDVPAMQRLAISNYWNGNESHYMQGRATQRVKLAGLPFEG